MTQDIDNDINGWHFTDEEIRHAIENEILLNPSLDLTNACNLNCPYCYIEDKNSKRKKRKSNELTIEETLKLIDDFDNAGAKTINIVGAGEPTIDPHFEEVVEYINSKSITTVVFTNGIKLANSDKLISFLYEKDVSPVIKLNSRKENIQDLLGGKKGYTQQRDIALSKLINAGFNLPKPTRLGVDILALKGNYEELTEIHKWCRENNIFPIIADYIPTGRTEGGQFVGFDALEEFKKREILSTLKYLLPVTNGERSMLLSNIEKADKKYKINRNGCMAYYGGGKCTQLLGLYVDIEGNIYPCVAKKININGKLKPVRLGNIRLGDNVRSIWKNHLYMQKIRETFDGTCPYKPLLIERKYGR